MSEVCRFWQAGHCKFGDSCRYSHGARMNNVFASSRFDGAATSSASAGGGGDLERQILCTVKQDMESVEKSGQWIFSCYSPAKDCASFPGLDDVSPEELRFEAYTAKANNTVEQYQAKIRRMAEEFAGKRAALKIPDQNVKQTLINIYNKANHDAGKGGQQAFGGGNSIFGKGNSSSSNSSQGLFGGGQAQSGGSIFGKSTFGNPGGGGGGGVFGGGSTQANNQAGSFGQPQNGSIFGKPSNPPTGLFGGGNNSGSIFGGKDGSTPQQGSIFGASNTNNTAATSSQNSIFGSGPQSGGGGGSLFGGNSQQQSSLFTGNSGGAAPAQLFGGSTGTQQAATIFTNPSQAAGNNAFSSGSIFSRPAVETKSPFGGNTGEASAPFGNPAGSANQPASSSQASIFGSPANSMTTVSSQPDGGQGNVFGGQTQVAPGGGQAAIGKCLFGTGSSGSSPFNSPAGGDGIFSKSSGASKGGGLFGKEAAPVVVADTSRMYTPIDALSEVELAAFRAESFDLETIPIKPPPRELVS